MPILLIFNIIIALIAASVASKKGRSTMGWFLLCFFTGFIPPFLFNLLILIFLLISADLREQRTRHAQDSAWRRRHHESMEQERVTNRNFREHVIKRLDRQDEALGLPPANDLPLDAPAPPKEIVTYPMLGNGTWYLVLNGQERGPVKEEEVVVMLKRGELSGDTYAWSEGMQDWQRANTIGNFCSFC
jgi:hypothetical protein